MAGRALPVPPERSSRAPRRGNATGNAGHQVDVARAAPPIGFPGLVRVLGRVCYERGDLQKHGARAAIAVPKEPAELVHRVRSDRGPTRPRVRVYPGARVEPRAASPTDRCVSSASNSSRPHPSRRADIFEPKALAFAVEAKPKTRKISREVIPLPVGKREMDGAGRLSNDPYISHADFNCYTIK